MGKITEPATVDQQAFFGMGEHIDKAWGNSLARGIDDDLSVSRQMRANGDNSVARHRHIAHKGCAARPVIDRPALDQHIKGLGRAGGQGDKGCEEYEARKPVQCHRDDPSSVFAVGSSLTEEGVRSRG